MLLAAVAAGAKIWPPPGPDAGGNANTPLNAAPADNDDL